MKRNENYLLSIIVPIRNESAYIEKLIDSFAKINDSRVELLISDNHSDDASSDDFIKWNEMENQMRQDRRKIYDEVSKEIANFLDSGQNVAVLCETGRSQFWTKK